MDIATLGIKVENGQVVKATASLEGMAVAGGKAEVATQRLSRRMALAEISAREMDAAMAKTSRTAQLLSSAFVGFSAIAVVGLIGKKTIEETIAAQNAMAQLEAAVASTGGVAGRTVAQLDALSMAMQRQTTYSDEAVKGAEAMLLTFDKIRGTEFDRATAAVTDLAARMGGDLQGAAVQVGKALQDPATGLTALRRSGVSFSAAQIDVIKTLYDTGRVAEGQRVILKELEHQFGGSAAAARDTLGGAIAGLKNSFGDLFEVTKGGSHGTVTALNAIAHALETSGLSMNTFMTNTVVGWNNISTAIQKAVNWLGVITNPASYAAVAALNEQLEKARVAANEAARAPAKAGPGAGGGGGSDRDADGLTPAEKEAQRIADQQANARNQVAIDEIRKREKEEKDRIRDQKRYADDITDIWDRGMADVVASTERGFQAVLDSVGSLIGNLLARMAKEGQSSFGLSMAGAAIAGGTAGFGMGQSLFSTSHGAAGNNIRGAFGGAAAGAAAGFMVAGPAGAAVGAMAGFVGGIVGVGSASKAAAKAMAEAVKQVTLSMDALRANVHGDVLGQGIAAIEADRAAQIKAVEEAWSGGDANSDRVRWRTAREKEINALEDERIAKLKQEYALSQTYAREDLEVRKLRAEGRAKEADALARQQAADREIAQAIADHRSDEYLATLRYVTGLELATNAMDRASTSALNMVEGYNIVAEAFRFSGMTSGMGGGATSGGGSYGSTYTPNGPIAVPTGGSRGTPQPTEPVMMQPVVLEVDGREMARVVKRVFIDQASKSADGDSYNWGRGT